MDFQKDVTEWIGEFGGAENAKPYAKRLAAVSPRLVRTTRLTAIGSWPPKCVGS
jgi:hypothetical protein